MTASIRRFFVAAVLLVGTLVLPVAVSVPAHAAACVKGTGVTVVVQGQGINSTTCVLGTKAKASVKFAEAGHRLDRAALESGFFVCRVDGRPASDPCGKASPADAYWALYHADGLGGSWVYSSVGVAGLDRSAGQWVAFVFQDSHSATRPSMTPVGPTSTPKPTQPKPTSSAPTKPADPKPTDSTRPNTAAPTAGGSTSNVPNDAPNPSANPSSPDDPAGSGDIEGSGSDSNTSSGPVEDVVNFVSGEDSSSWVPVALTIALVIALGAGAAVAARRRAS